MVSIGIGWLIEGCEMRRTGLVTVAAVLGVGLSAALAASASAATTIGQTAETLLDFCSGDTFVQDGTGPAPGYEVPAGGGVITSYSIFALPGTSTSQFFLKVLARTSSPFSQPATMQVVGSDGPRELVPGQLNTFQTRISVKGGEVLGEWFPHSDTVSCTIHTPSYDDSIIYPDPAAPEPKLGDTITFTAPNYIPQPRTRLNLSAVVEPLPPQLTNVTQSAESWIGGNALPSIRPPGARPPVGTTFGFTLDRPARVWFLFTYRTIGRLVGGRCLAQTNANRGSARCLLTVRAAFSRQAHAGRTRLRFQGRLDRKRKLPPGFYRLLIFATANGHRSKAAILRFAIVPAATSRTSPAFTG